MPAPASMNRVMDPFGRTFNRLLAVFGLSIVFVATASVISPRTSTAGPAGSSSMSEGEVIGRLIGREHEIVILASSLGPRYTVYDLAGNALAEKLTIEQLGRRFPGLDSMISEMTRAGDTLRMGIVDETHASPVGSDR